MTAIAALADVDICNMALSHLGVSAFIQSLDPPDKSETAKACAFWYPKMRDQLLQSAPWDFAYVNQVLASDPTTMPGWGYAYQYPNDCLQAITVAGQYGLRFGQAYWANYWCPEMPTQMDTAKVPYKVVQSQQAGKAILCDLPTTSPAYLFYIQGVTDTSLFSPMFADTLSFMIAARAGGILRSDKGRIQACMQLGNQGRLEALAQVMNQSQQDPERVSPSISVRW